MNASRVFFAMAAALAVGLSYGVVRAQGKTVWDGVYSDAQAKRGEALFGDKCAMCHGADLSGGDAAGQSSEPDAGSSRGSDCSDPQTKQRAGRASRSPGVGRFAEGHQIQSEQTIESLS